MKTPESRRNVPRTSAIIFLLAVFFTFASFGFATDIIDMGRHSPLEFALGVLIAGFFAVAYAASGIYLRSQFWKAGVPIFFVQFLCSGMMNRWFPDTKGPAFMNAQLLGRLHGRLTFDAVGIVALVCIGYTGFVYVSISEGRRHGRDQTAKALLEGEMVAAREVQRVMVPEDLPSIDNYAIESIYRPAAEVGGDFFQVVPLKSGRALVVIGDVSGKGLRAAMVVSMIVGALRTASEYSEEPDEILGELNRRLCGHMPEGFATCLALRLEEEGKLTLANAGHLSPYWNGSELQLAGSLPLGLDGSAAYEQTTLKMQIGDVLMLLTDGIAEAQNDQRALLGFAEIESVLRAGATAGDIAEIAQRFGQTDDITVMSVLRLL